VVDADAGREGAVATQEAQEAILVAAEIDTQPPKAAFGQQDRVAFRRKADGQ